MLMTHHQGKPFSTSQTDTTANSNTLLPSHGSSCSAFHNRVTYVYTVHPRVRVPQKSHRHCSHVRGTSSVHLVLTILTILGTSFCGKIIDSRQGNIQWGERPGLLDTASVSWRYWWALIGSPLLAVYCMTLWTLTYWYRIGPDDTVAEEEQVCSKAIDYFILFLFQIWKCLQQKQTNPAQRQLYG